MAKGGVPDVVYIATKALFSKMAKGNEKFLFVNAPKGIQHSVKYIRKVFKSYQSLREIVPNESVYLTTTCHFHIG